MKGISLKTKLFCIGRDKITYLNLTLKVNVTVTQFYMRHSVMPKYIHIQSMKGAGLQIKMSCTRQDCVYRQDGQQMTL